LKVYFHFRFSVRGCFTAAVRILSWECFPIVSEFNLARIALELTMPTIFARTDAVGEINQHAGMD
jgi:hypothetical protein